MAHIEFKLAKLDIVDLTAYDSKEIQMKFNILSANIERKVAILVNSNVEFKSDIDCIRKDLFTRSRKIFDFKTIL